MTSPQAAFSSVKPSSDYEKDLEETRRNRANLARNVNLVFWYGKLYDEQLGGIPDVDQKRILEIGSGVSPLKNFYCHVLTSDVLELDYLDYTFDCHEIDQVEEIPDGSLDVITLTNVLHHLRDCRLFLEKAALKLKPGGKIIATEPYYSAVSWVIYKFLHHEPSLFNIDEPVLKDISGPLTSSNMAIPQTIFLSSRGWDRPLRKTFTFSDKSILFFSSLSYMATGGISRRIPIPRLLYRTCFHLDMVLSKMFPTLFAAFFTVTLTKRSV